MRLSSIESVFKIAIISISLMLSGQLYAADMNGPVPPIPGLNVPLDTPHPAKKHKKKKKKNKHKKNKNGKGHKHVVLSPETRAEKTIEDCKKLLATPAPEKEAKRKAKKRKRCEDLMTKEGIPATAPATDAVTAAPVEGQAPAPETAPAGSAAEPAEAPAPEVAPAEAPAPEAAPAEGGTQTAEATPVEAPAE